MDGSSFVHHPSNCYCCLLDRSSPGARRITSSSQPTAYSSRWSVRTRTWPWSNVWFWSSKRSQFAINVVDSSFSQTAGVMNWGHCRIVAQIERLLCDQFSHNKHRRRWNLVRDPFLSNRVCSFAQQVARLSPPYH